MQDIKEKLSKTKDIDLEKLGLINQGLFYVNGDLANRYKSVLKEVFDLDCDLDEFRLDKRGLSPELSRYFKEKFPERFEFGENYLNIQSANRFMIVLSPEQKDANLISPQTSYENDLFDRVYKLARHTIEDIAQNEALFGQINNGIRVYTNADDALRLRNIDLTLDTQRKTISSTLELSELALKLGEEENALDNNYIFKMQELVKITGDLRKRNVSDIFPIKREVHCFYVEFFNGIHCLRNFTNSDDIRSILVTDKQEIGELEEGILHFDIRDSNLIDTLHKYKFLEFDPNLAAQRMEEIEDEFLLKEGIDLLEITDYQRKKKIYEFSSAFPKSWSELKKVARITTNKKNAKSKQEKKRVSNLISRMSFDTKAKLSSPVSKDDIINHMLAELDPTDIIRLYQDNIRIFKPTFESMSLNRKKYAAYKLLTHIQGGKK